LGEGMVHQFHWFVLGVLAVWRVTHLLYGEDGPWNLMARLRGRAGRAFIGELLDCFYCLSLWVAAPFAMALGEGIGDCALLWLALSGGAIMIERLSARSDPPVLPHWSEENDDVLRQEPSQNTRCNDSERAR
jgi:hypothetical protein